MKLQTKMALVGAMLLTVGGCGGGVPTALKTGGTATALMTQTRAVLINALTHKARWSHERMDTDRDGYIGPQEIEPALATSFGVVDANHDNRLSLPEVIRYMTGRKVIGIVRDEIRYAFQRQDKNTNQRLDVLEFRDMMDDQGPYTYALRETDFVLADLNRDHVLDLSECEDVCATTAILPVSAPHLDAFALPNMNNRV